MVIPIPDQLVTLCRRRATGLREPTEDPIVVTAAGWTISVDVHAPRPDNRPETAEAGRPSTTETVRCGRMVSQSVLSWGSSAIGTWPHEADIHTEVRAKIDMSDCNESLTPCQPFRFRSARRDAGSRRSDRGDGLLGLLSSERDPGKRGTSTQRQRSDLTGGEKPAMHDSEGRQPWPAFL
jgi:hypothetical protein